MMKQLITLSEEN